MPWTRRQFLETGMMAGLAAGLPGAGRAMAPPGRRTDPLPYFDLHPFITANPGAVFIRRTRVAHKMDSEAKRAEGLQLALEIFVPADKPGVPITHRVILKPNVTSVRSRRPNVENWGTGTDPDFYEGLVMGLKELGLKKFHFVEANGYHAWNYRGFVDINDRHGIEMNECERRMRNFREGYEMTWTRVPDAVVYQRIPHYAPVNEPDTWLLNIAKWKAHGMCLTQSVKNEQGLVIVPYVRFCPGWKMVTGVPDFMKPDIHPEVEPRIKRYFDNHRRLGYARYDSPAPLSPMHQEIWDHKTCDNMSVLKTGLAMIEGIYGRDGNGFDIGNDYLTNLVMFSKDKFRLDMIGLWLAGHEPGNVNLYRIAKERSLSSTFNPWEVPVYEWTDGRAVPRRLSDFPRTPLKTYYLQKEGEPEYHLVDEPFNYDRIKV
ncbi:MAG: DUF362 domain-containing protein [Acidobacteria bacterium]|nr:DUF362 domain-containing protein [Acidobacteriota bacterium]